MRDIDQIIRSIMNICPTVEARQLKVSHPGADDDGLWFFQQRDSEFEVQIESSTGMCPFLIETDESDARFTAKSIEETLGFLLSCSTWNGRVSHPPTRNCER
jgi:hypothetical protein